MNNLICIAGPTASGKTALSIALAKELGGEIVSCDSMQVYKASNTWLGSRLPDVQAEPEDAQTPLASNSRSKDSPSMPSKQKLTLPGSRLTGSPFSAQ